jgi:peptidoglycan/LPS O-acetylase OafA/YrhL
MLAFCVQNSLVATFVYQHGIPWSPRPLICNILTTAVTTQLVASLITKKKVPLFKISSLILLILVIADIFYGWKKSQLDTDFFFRFGYCAAFISLLMLPVTLWFKRVPVTILKKWSYLGSISYALYAVHFPILILFNNLSSMVSKFPLRLLVFNLIGASISILIAWLLECQMQPKVAKYLKARFGL